MTLAEVKKGKINFLRVARGADLATVNPLTAGIALRRFESIPYKTR
jgi:hypothetical protein